MKFTTLAAPLLMLSAAAAKEPTNKMLCKNKNMSVLKAIDVFCGAHKDRKCYPNTIRTSRLRLKLTQHAVTIPSYAGNHGAYGFSPRAMALITGNCKPAQWVRQR